MLYFPHAVRLTYCFILIGTLKDDQHCYLCGQNGHRQFECPNQAMEVYKLPTAIQSKVQEQYEKDVSRMAGDGQGPGQPSSLFLCISSPS